jgi:hypothetical protein
MLSTRQIAQALGGQVAGAQTILCPGPGHSHQDRSLAVRLDPHAPDGFICFSHCGDDWRDCRDYVRDRLGLPQYEYKPRNSHGHIHRRNGHIDPEAETINVPLTFSEAELGRIAWAQNIWNEAKDPRGTLAETYLRHYRKLDLPDELCGTVLRFHPACPWRNDSGTVNYVPVLVVPFRSIDNDTITAVHRVALNADGSKTERRMLGVVRRAAIKLDALSDSDALVIGEGVETSMAARQYMAMDQIARMPVWATGSAGAISFFPLIDNVKKLFILGENNDGGANARAIALCRTRSGKHGRKIAVIQPEQAFNDMNDALIETINDTMRS